MSDRRRKKVVAQIIAVVGIFLLLLGSCLTVAGVGWFGSVREWLAGKGIEWKDVRVAGRNVYTTREQEQVFSVQVPVTVVIRNQVGAITVVGTDDDSVSIRADVKAWGATDQLAEKAEKAVRVEMVQPDPTHIEVAGIIEWRVPGGRTPQVTITLEVPWQCELEVKSSVSDVAVEGIDGPMRIVVGVGNVRIAGVRPQQNWYISADYGEINLELPDSSSFQLDARVDTGQIESDSRFQGESKKRYKSNGEDLRLRGVVGKAPEALLTLTVKTGAIRLKRSR